MNGVQWILNWDVKPTITIKMPETLDDKKFVGTVCFDCEIFIPGIVKLCIPSVLLWPNDQLTEQFINDIKGYLDDAGRWVDYLKRVGFEFERDWLTPEIRSTIPFGITELDK